MYKRSSKFFAASHKNLSNLFNLHNPSFLFAGALLFDEKIRQSAAQAVFWARLGDIKPPSKYKMYSSRIF
jgi:hypothetical protein